MNDFLPSDYKVPVSGGHYMKLQDGENTLRILSSAVIGYEYWNTENKPIRLKEMPSGTPDDIRLEKGKPTPIKHFWAFVVWNYSSKQIQILELTQKTVMTAIKALVDNKKWGDPKKYDITVTKTGEMLNTEYSTMPNPHSELEPEIKQLWEETDVNLEALFSSDDPFNSDSEVTTDDYSDSIPAF